jgi:hypothetical protein
MYLYDTFNITKPTLPEVEDEAERLPLPAKPVSRLFSKSGPGRSCDNPILGLY